MPRKSRRKHKSGEAVKPHANRLKYALRVYAGHGYMVARSMIMKKFGVSHATAERDLADANEAMAKSAKQEAPYERVRLTAQYRRIAAKAERREKFSAAVQALRALARVNGLEVEVVSIGNATTEQMALLGALTLTPHQRQQRLEQLRAAAKPTAPAAKPDADE